MFFIKVTKIKKERRIKTIRILTKLDYEKMKNIMYDFHHELYAYVFHPHRLLRISKKYEIEFYDLLNIY
jgi:hypothetical protein